jgi:transcriptional regulator with XRE-family HTH domain
MVHRQDHLRVCSTALDDLQLQVENILMAIEDSPRFVRGQLGRQLRVLRKSARIDARTAADALEWSESKLSRVENGLSGVDVHAVKSMLDLYGVGVDQWSPILELVRIAKRKGWWREFTSTDSGFVPLETAASRSRAFTYSFLYGLLQTEAYMRAVLASLPVARTSERFEAQVAVRLRRQLRLTDESDRLDFVNVIDEGSLRRQIGGREVMCEQLTHMAEMAQLPNVVLQVIPLEVGVRIGFHGSFTVLSFADRGEPDIVHVDDLFRQSLVDREEDVRFGIKVFDHLQGLALDPEDSISRILSARAAL